MEPKEEPFDDFPVITAENEIANHAGASLKEPKEEPLELFSFDNETANQSSTLLMEPKEEPLELFCFENNIPQPTFMEETICKKEEVDDDVMGFPHFDMSLFAPPNEYFPIPSFPMEPKEEEIKAEYDSGEEGEKMYNIGWIDQDFMDSSYDDRGEKKRRPSYSSTRLPEYSEEMSDDDEDVEPSMKKSKSNTEQMSDYVKTPQCILCEAFPATPSGYAKHIYRNHNSTLTANGIYLLCSCGLEVGSVRINQNHNYKCDRQQFTVHKINKKIRSTPQCVLCEVYPKTASAYANHLNKVHKSTLIANEIYLHCSCGVEVRSCNSTLTHNGECDRLQYSLHKVVPKANSHQVTLHGRKEKVHSTPQCILCETYPSTASAYTQHLNKVHKSTLIANDIYLQCSCGVEIRSCNSILTHNGECDRRQYSLHKAVPKANSHRVTLHGRNKSVHATPQCVMCEVYPSTASAYAKHLKTVHKSTLIANEIYLQCSCGVEIRHCYSTLIHNGECDRLQYSLHKLVPECDRRKFSLHKVVAKVESTPQCVMCEVHPPTIYTHVVHLKCDHKSTLEANGIFLVCACGIEVRSFQYSLVHNGECDGRQFTLHKLDEN